MTTPSYLPMISIATNVLMVIIGGLLARWIGSVLQGVKLDIRIAILELEKKLAEGFATKADLQVVRGEIRLSERIDVNHAEVVSLIKRRPRGRTSEAAT